MFDPAGVPYAGQLADRKYCSKCDASGGYLRVGGVAVLDALKENVFEEFC